MLPDVAHTFRAGHRIMIQVQSSWFPLTDRNPQKFMDILNAKASDFVKATQRVFVGGPDGSRIQFLVVE
jgi:predicted acyl esterase